MSDDAIDFNDLNKRMDGAISSLKNDLAAGLAYRERMAAQSAS